MSDTKKNDYRDTVFLPKTDFPMRGSLPVKEPELLTRWKEIELAARIRAGSKGRAKFVLHDGPPFANGNIHLGHALNKILKDVIVRNRQMLGFDAPYVPGWDCHGLPIEWKIEEQYRAKGQDKDTVPKLQFRAECRAFAKKWVEVQSGEFQRLGVNGDWAKPYLTMSFRSEAQILREIYKFLQNGLLFKGKKPIMWSVVEKTSLAEAEIEYHDHKSTTLWVKFPVVKSPNEELKGASIVIWTTTPWTIPANRAIAYGDFHYALIEVESAGEGAKLAAGDKVIVAEELLEQFKSDAKIEGAKILRQIKPEELKGVICAHPFRGREGSESYFDYDVPLLHGDFVTVDAGTGFVHIAPGHGEDDFRLGQREKIAFDETVGDDGRYLPNVKGFEGLYVYKPDGKEGEANVAVIKALAAAGALVGKKNITHSYPHSWRSKAPLIFRTTPQWFIALDQKIEGGAKTLRELAKDGIEATQFFPALGKNRIGGMVETRPDWCISRQREWGVPIALFVSKKDGKPLKDKAVLDRVAAAFEAEGADAWYAHAPQDFLGDAYNAEDYEQVFDIVDVWFESGSTHSFCLDQTEGASLWPDLQWPASLYLEGSDQHRGWFQASLLEACGTRGCAPFKEILTHGFTLDEKGFKQSKSLGNVIAPQDAYEKSGADILRLWVVSTDFSQDMSFGPNILKQTADLYRRFRNTLRYLLGALDGFTPTEAVEASQMPELERWVLNRIAEIDAILREDSLRYDFNHMLQELHAFCAVDLSAVYFDIRKDSLYCDAPDSLKRRSARTAMSLLLDHLLPWLAPILCFTAEEAFLARNPGTKDSVHLLSYPVVPAAWADKALASKWDAIRAIRRVVTGALEVKRNDKTIGASLQAAPVLYLSNEKAALLEGLDFAEICICSGIEIKTGPAPDGAFTLPDVADAACVVALAEGRKCARCWQIGADVGEEDELCPRCRAVLAGQKGVSA
jgi:isoleucyl-tRNA synthetase